MEMPAAGLIWPAVADALRIAPLLPVGNPFWQRRHDPWPPMNCPGIRYFLELTHGAGPWRALSEAGWRWLYSRRYFAKNREPSAELVLSISDK